MKQQKWLNIITILFIIFIIIPIVLKMFNIKIVEGLNNLDTTEDGTVTSNLNIINSNLMDICNNMFSDDDAIKKIDDESGNMIKQILNLVKKVSTKIEEKESAQLEKLKCIADFGTNVKDDLPNGAGILTNTKYVCPSEYPKCNGLVCGKQYGYCSKS